MLSTWGSNKELLIECIFKIYLFLIGGFPSGSVVKNPRAVQEIQEMWVRSLGQENSLEKGMASHSSILAWRIPWTEEPGGLHSMGSQSWMQLSD